MRLITAVALLAVCQAVYAQPHQEVGYGQQQGYNKNAQSVPESVKKQSQIDNIFGSIVSFQNALLAPLAPFGRKLQEKDQQNDWQTNWLNTNNPLVQQQIVKGNAIGSLFYGVGFATPGVLQEAFTGQPSGRRLLQDPYHLTSKANVVASLLRGYKPNLSPLWQQPTFSPPLYDQFTQQPKPTSSPGSQENHLLGQQNQLDNQKLGRKLLQDVVAANYLGSAVVNNVNVLDLLLGQGKQDLNNQGHSQGYHQRKLNQIYPDRTGYQQTGFKNVQENAVGSLLDKSGSWTNGVLDRKAILGFNQDQNRHLLADKTSPLEAIYGQNKN